MSPSACHHYSIRRTNGVVSTSLPSVHSDKPTLMVANNFAYLLPRTSGEISGPAFAALIEQHCDSAQAQAVVHVLRTA